MDDYRGPSDYNSTLPYEISSGAPGEGLKKALFAIFAIVIFVVTLRYIMMAVEVFLFAVAIAFFITVIVVPLVAIILSTFLAPFVFLTSGKPPVETNTRYGLGDMKDVSEKKDPEKK